MSEQTNKPWTADRVLFAMARHFTIEGGYRIITEFEIDGGRADLLIVNRSLYATEVEIKVSVSDWNADRVKEKWKTARPHVRRFFYAIPETLVEKIPDWLPDYVGVFYVRAHPRGVDMVNTARPARLLDAQKVPDLMLRKLDASAYHRFWRIHLDRLRERAKGAVHV